MPHIVEATFPHRSLWNGHEFSSSNDMVDIFFLLIRLSLIGNLTWKLMQIAVEDIALRARNDSHFVRVWKVDSIRAGFRTISDRRHPQHALRARNMEDYLFTIFLFNIWHEFLKEWKNILLLLIMYRK